MEELADNHLFSIGIIIIAVSASQVIHFQLFCFPCSGQLFVPFPIHQKDQEVVFQDDCAVTAAMTDKTDSALQFPYAIVLLENV